MLQSLLKAQKAEGRVGGGLADCWACLLFRVCWCLVFKGLLLGFFVWDSQVVFGAVGYTAARSKVEDSKGQKGPAGSAQGAWG